MKKTAYLFIISILILICGYEFGQKQIINTVKINKEYTYRRINIRSKVFSLYSINLKNEQAD